MAEALLGSDIIPSRNLFDDMRLAIEEQEYCFMFDAVLTLRCCPSFICHPTCGSTLASTTLDYMWDEGLQGAFSAKLDLTSLYTGPLAKRDARIGIDWGFACSQLKFIGLKARGMQHAL